MQIHPFWESYPHIKKDLTQTISLINQQIKLTNKDVELAIKQLLNAGGKLLRPAYQLLFSQLGPNQITDKKIAIAAAIETLHLATLIHDDIVDKADIRRNQPSIQTQFGQDVAVYAGDYLFVVAFKLLAKHASDMRAIELNTQSIEKILTGELGQMNVRYKWSVTVDEYLTNIHGKTAELFGLSCFMGAYESGCSLKFAESCRHIGENIGMAFQILDDILDYSSISDDLGKPVLEDMKNGVYTLPLLIAIKKEHQILHPLLAKKSQLTEQDSKLIVSCVQSSSSLNDAHNLAKEYTEKAIKAIDKLPTTKQETKTTITTITKELLYREH